MPAGTSCPDSVSAEIVRREFALDVVAGYSPRDLISFDLEGSFVTAAERLLFEPVAALAQPRKRWRSSLHINRKYKLMTILRPCWTMLKLKQCTCRLPIMSTLNGCYAPSNAVNMCCAKSLWR